MNLLNKHIVVTGGTGGIGSRLCRELILQGANTTVVARDDVLEFSGKVIRGDLSTVTGINEVAKQLQELQQQQEIDILINLAGLQYFGVIDQQSPEHTALLFNLNLLAPILLSQALLTKMKETGRGHIVNIGSIFGSINFPHFVSYSSSKAGLKAFSEALRREVSSYGIDVSYIAPRGVNTPFNSYKVRQYADISKMKMDDPQSVVAQLLSAITKKKKDTYLGFPEKLFVRINAIFPRIVDAALATETAKVKKMLNNERRL